MVQKGLVLRPLSIKRCLPNRSLQKLANPVALPAVQFSRIHPLRAFQKRQMALIMRAIASRSLTEAVCRSRKVLEDKRHPKIKITLLAGSVVHGVRFAR